MSRASNPAVGLSQAQADRIKQAQIANAVAETVAEHGYAGASVRRVCARAGTSNKTYYQFFRARCEAFFYARRRLLADLGAAMDRAWALHRDHDTATRTIGAAAALATWVARHPGPARVCFAEAAIASAIAGTPDRHLDELRAWCDRHRDALPDGSGLGHHELVVLTAGMLHGALSAGEVGAEAIVVGLARMLAVDTTPAEVRSALAVAALASPAAVPRAPAPVLEDIVGGLGDGRRTHDAIERLRELVVQATVEGDEVTLRAVQELLADGRCDGRLPPATRVAVRGLGELAAAALAGGPRSVLELAGRGGSGRRALPSQGRRALGMIAERPGLNGRELGASLGIDSDAQLSRVLRGLRSGGLIRDAGLGQRAWQITERGTAVLQTARGSV